VPIVQNIPRKQGTIQQRPTTPVSKRGNTVFPPNYTTPANVGDVLNPGNPSYLTAVGKDYNNQISSTGGATNPTATQRDTATQGYVPILQQVGQASIVYQKQTPEVQPHEKGTFFAPRYLNETKSRQSGGVSPTSDSAFHPVQPPANRPQRHPARAGERTSANSFTSKQTLSAKPQNDMTGSRWGVIKRSAAESPVPSNLTVPQTARQAVGSSWIQSVSRAPVQNQSHVGGGGFGSKWSPPGRPLPAILNQTPNYAHGGPAASVPTFPQKLGCKKGCS
jgi:hypothetical protein